MNPVLAFIIGIFFGINLTITFAFMYSAANKK